jgi:precorrin-3B synthase
MESGDGLVVRIRPRLGRLSVTQAHGVAAAALAHGNGLIEVTARANVQLRGVTAASHAPLLARLDALGLLDATEAEERHRNVVITPFSQPGDGTDALALSLYAALRTGPDLPGKFGFAIDTGPARVLAETSADIRIERAEGGEVILRADGADGGVTVTPETAVPMALKMAEWFVASGGVQAGRGRMAAQLARVPLPFARDIAPARALPPPAPGLRAEGALVALEFGILRAETFAALATHPLRTTPWRMLLVEGRAVLPEAPGLITDPADARLRVLACSGSPACPQALQKTRGLARSLAPAVPHGRILHVSGCAKGCAHPGRADLTLTATAKGFAVLRGGRAMDMPTRILPVDAITPALVQGEF